MIGIFTLILKFASQLRPFEPELWPNDPPTFKTSFDNVFQILKAIAWETFLSVADFEGHQLGDAKTINAVEQWVGTKSSLSLIHYFPRESGTISPCDAHEGISFKLGDMQSKLN